MESQELARLERAIRRVQRDHDWALGFEPRGSDPLTPEAVRLVDCRPGEGDNASRPRALSDWCSAGEALAWLAGYQAGQERASSTEGTRTKRRSLRQDRASHRTCGQVVKGAVGDGGARRDESQGVGSTRC